MKVMNKRKFKRMLKEKMLVFGTAGIGKTTIVNKATIPPFFDEVNQAPPETLNTLYEITHRKVSHQKPYRYIPYKHGKHAYKKDKYTYATKNMCDGKFKTCTNTQTGVTIILRRVK